MLPLTHEIAVLLGGGNKKGQQRDIDKALDLWEDYKRRKTATTQPAKPPTKPSSTR